MNDNIAEVSLEDQTDQRIDDVVNQGSDDVLEGSTYDDTNSHVHDIALEGKFLKLFEKFLHMLLFLSPLRPSHLFR